MSDTTICQICEVEYPVGPDWEKWHKKLLCHQFAELRLAFDGIRDALAKQIQDRPYESAALFVIYWIGVWVIWK